MSFLESNCEHCLHSEVCKFVDKIKGLNELATALTINLEGCKHYLCSVNWTESEDCSTSDCDNNCEKHTDNLVKSILEDWCMGKIRKRVVAPVECEDIEAPLLQAVIDIVFRLKSEPLSVTLTTPQLISLLGEESFHCMGDNDFGIEVLGKRLTLNINENITACYVSYREVTYDNSSR